MRNTCAVIKCERLVDAKGMCLMHYKRARVAAAASVDLWHPSLAGNVTVGELPEHRPDLGPCWEWQGAKNAAGYGVVSAPRFGSRLAHRLAKVCDLNRMLTGSLMHHCDNPPCVRPSHLSEATHAENMRDKAQKGRAVAPRAGQQACKNGHALSPETTVEYVRPDGYTERRCLECRRAANKKQAERRKRERHARGLKRS